MSADPLLETLLEAPADPAERALAARHAPVIRFDEREPFMPLAAGYTIFRADGPSPSFPRQVVLRSAGRPDAALAIEYAIWWDWDIGHLYELEHIWVYLDDAGRLVHAEASWHGGFHDMRQAGAIPREGERAVVCSEPGKHAFAPDPAWFTARAEPHQRSTTEALAGAGGLLVTELFRDTIRRTPLADTLARTYLARRAFTPAYAFTRRFTFGQEQLAPWPALREWIPGRVGWWAERLRREIPPEQYRHLRIGHRGAAGHAPDNSLAGVAAAADLGADAVEIDARLTRDGVAVASHDALLLGADGRPLVIGEHTLDELRAAGGRPIATLDEVVARCRALRLGLYLELKEGGAAQPALACLQAHDHTDAAIVAAFRPDWLADVRSLAPDMPTSVLFSSPQIDAVALAAACGASYVHPCWERRSARPDTLLTAEWAAAVRAAGLGIITWHEERPEVIDGLRRRGVDGICSDLPELLR